MKIFIHLVLLITPLFATSANCPLGEYSVKSHNRRAYVRADGTFVNATVVSSHCRKQRESDNYWHDKFEISRPSDWPHKQEILKSWTVEEKERVLDAICELPDSIWKNSKYKLYRMKKSKDGKNPATSANGILVLYDTAFTQKNVLSRVIAHEFAHEVYGNLKSSDAQDYHFATNWFEVNTNGKRLRLARKDGFVADDGRVSPEEDFANNLEFFLFDDKSLKSKTLNAYKWIADHFGDNLNLRKCNK